MELLRRDVLERAGGRNAPLRNWLNQWAESVESARWESLQDVRATYPATDGVKLKSTLIVTVFNVKGNEYRLLSAINYQTQVVVALEVLTHAEYDKDIWKGRY